MIFNSLRQLKDWLKNKEITEGIPSNTLLNYYMMERLLERISISKYNDATLKGIPISQEKIIVIIKEIIALKLEDNISFEIINVKNIHSSGKYEDYRITIEAKFFNLKEYLKIDLTTADMIIPREIEYKYRLMFEDRTIKIMAYHLYTILAEKLETILSRNIANTRAKDFYDIYILSKLYKEEIDTEKLNIVLKEKCVERNTIRYLEAYSEYVALINDSDELKEVWTSYQHKNKYADNIQWDDIIESINLLLGTT